MQHPPIRKRDASSTRESILESAHALFVEHGFSKTSMRDIALGCGVTKSLIHHHFGNKQCLWEQVKMRGFQTYVSEQMAQLARQKVDVPMLGEAVVALFAFLKGHPDVVRLFAWAHLEGDESCGTLDHELVALAAKRIAEAQAAGSIRDDVAALHILVTFIATATQWFEAADHFGHWFEDAGAGDSRDQPFVDDFLKIFLAGIAPLPRDS